MGETLLLLTDSRHSGTTVKVEYLGEFENILECEAEAHMESIHERSQRSKSQVSVPLRERFLECPLIE